MCHVHLTFAITHLAIKKKCYILFVLTLCSGLLAPGGSSALSSLYCLQPVHRPFSLWIWTCAEYLAAVLADPRPHHL